MAGRSRVCPALALALALVVTGCETAITATGVVLAPPEVRALVSRTAPAYLYLTIEYGRDRQETSLGTFCSLPARVPFEYFKFSCVKTDTATVTASLRALPPSVLPKDWSCENQVEVPIERTEPLLAAAAAEVPFDRSGTLCDSGSLRAELTLVPSKRPGR